MKESLQKSSMYRKIRRIHFVGIGGTGMSGLAEVLLRMDYKISGSDLVRSEVTDRLAELGAEIFIGHVARQVRGADLVVVSSAIGPENPEVRAGRRLGLPTLRRGEMLAEVMRLHSVSPWAAPTARPPPPPWRANSWPAPGSIRRWWWAAGSR